MTSENKLYTYDGLEMQHGHESMRGGGIYKDAGDDMVNAFLSSDLRKYAAKKYHVVYAADLSLLDIFNIEDDPSKFKNLTVFSDLKVGGQADPQAISKLAVKFYLNFIAHEFKKDYAIMWTHTINATFNAHYHLELSEFQWKTVLLQPISVGRIWTAENFIKNIKWS
jgi:hypothetical protein